MFSFNVRKILCGSIALAALWCSIAPERLAAASPNKGALVTFTASGTFASPAFSGNDTLKLAGQAFTISVAGESSLTPIQHGQNWAIFKPLTMTGTIYSGLIPNQPIPIASATGAIDQTVGASEDIFQSGFPVVVQGIAVNVRAKITLPGGTLTTALLRPFASVALDTSNATVTYFNTTASTELLVQTGTLVATVPAGGNAEKAAVAAPSAFVVLASAQAVKPRVLLSIWQ